MAAAAFPAAPPKARKHGVLLLAYDAGGAWRNDMPALRAALQGLPMETVETANRLALQRAIDRLTARSIGKIVAVPLEPVSESLVMDQTRYLFGVREEPVLDAREEARAGGFKPLKAPRPSTLVLAVPHRFKRLGSTAELVLAGAIDKSTTLVEILADRAKALSRRPERDALVLAGLAPNSDKGLEAWKTAGEAIARETAAKAGFREGALIWVRDAVRSSQRDDDIEQGRATLRRLITAGGVAMVPLALDGGRVGSRLKREFSGFAYRWDGKALAGDRRLVDWIRATAEAGAQLPDSRQYRDDAPRAPPGGLR